MRKEIGIGMAAEMLGVSVSTLKRMCDEGLIPNFRTSGGHRRFEQPEIELMQARVKGQAGKYLTAARPDPHEQLLFMLICGYSVGIFKLLETLRAEQPSMPQLLDEYFVSALLTLPTKASSEDQVAMAEQTASEVLEQLLATKPEPNSDAPRAVGVSAGDRHNDVASRLVEVALSYSGMPASNLGRLPARDAPIKELDSLNASSVWLAIIHDGAFSDLVTLSQTVRGQLAADQNLVLYSGCRSLSKHSQWNIEAYFTSLSALCAYQSARYSGTPPPA